MNSRKGLGANGWLGIFVLGTMFLGCAGCIGGCASGGIQFSEGHREGTVQKFFHKGLFWKTWEGELALRGWQFKGGDNSTMTNVFEFSVANEEIARQIDALHADEEVRLHYRQYMCPPPWKGATGYFIVRVERLQK